MISKLIDLNINRMFFDYRTSKNLVFETDLGNRIFTPYGDHFINGVFTYISNVNNLIGSKIISVKQNVIGTVINFGEAKSFKDEDRIYGLELKTNKGKSDIIFRIKCNREGNGWLKIIDELPLDVTMIELTSDYKE